MWFFGSGFFLERILFRVLEDTNLFEKKTIKKSENTVTTFFENCSKKYSIFFFVFLVFQNIKNMNFNVFLVILVFQNIKNIV